MKLILIITFITLIDFITSECQKILSSTQRAVLDFHNELRRLHVDTPDVCYGRSDSTHRFFPQEWAEFLLPRGPKNAGHSDGIKQVGENIAWNSEVTMPVEDYLLGIKKWYDEIIQYQFQNGGKDNKKNNIGHVTQIAWHDTKEIRCGRAAKRKARKAKENQNKKDGINKGVFIVCQYWPRGNVGALLASEVKPLKRVKSNYFI